MLWPDCSDLRRTLAEKVQAIYDYLQIDAVIVHPTDRCLIASGDAVKVAQGTLVDRPVITTGGGDNFNAGFCMAYLLGLSFEECARTAMAVSGFYVRNGYSPSFEELVAYMKM